VPFDTVLFERHIDLPLGFWWLVASQLVVCILIVLAWCKHAASHQSPTIEPDKRGWLRMLPASSGLLKAAAIVFAVTILFGASNVIEWQKLKQNLATVKPTVIEGVISAATAKRIIRPGNSANPSYFDRETLQINERVITTESNDPSTPFPLLIENGGKLKMGERVRMTLIGETIIKVETNND
jgi:hypothetical protein